MVQGVAAVVFGPGAPARPGLTLALLITTHGAHALIDRVALLAGMFLASGVGTSRLAWLLRGHAAGLPVFVWRGMTTLVLVNLIIARALWQPLREALLAQAPRRSAQLRPGDPFEPGRVVLRSARITRTLPVDGSATLREPPLR